MEWIDEGLNLINGDSNDRGICILLCFDVACAKHKPPCPKFNSAMPCAYLGKNSRIAC